MIAVKLKKGFQQWSKTEVAFSSMSSQHVPNSHVTFSSEAYPHITRIRHREPRVNLRTYNMACDVSGAGDQIHFTFDRVLSMGALSRCYVLPAGWVFQVQLFSFVCVFSGGPIGGCQFSLQDLHVIPRGALTTKVPPSLPTTPKVVISRLTTIARPSRDLRASPVPFIWI